MENCVRPKKEMKNASASEAVRKCLNSIKVNSLFISPSLFLFLCVRLSVCMSAAYLSVSLKHSIQMHIDVIFCNLSNQPGEKGGVFPEVFAKWFVLSPFAEVSKKHTESKLVETPQNNKC